MQYPSAALLRPWPQEMPVRQCAYSDILGVPWLACGRMCFAPGLLATSLQAKCYRGSGLISKVGHALLWACAHELVRASGRPSQRRHRCDHDVLATGPTSNELHVLTQAANNLKFNVMLPPRLRLGNAQKLMGHLCLAVCGWRIAAGAVRLECCGSVAGALRIDLARPVRNCSKSPPSLASCQERGKEAAWQNVLKSFQSCTRIRQMSDKSSQLLQDARKCIS